MTNKFLSFLASIIVFAAIVLAAVNVFALDADKPDVHVGDRWSWQHTNGLANEKDFTIIEDVVEVSDNEIRTRRRVKGKYEIGITTYSREWNPIDVGDAQYTPNLKAYTFPLAVGKKWKGDADKRLLFRGKHGRFYLDGEVVAFEKITVPAGTFDAYKINLVLNAHGTDEDVNIGNTVETIWYAPSVKRYVKLENIFKRDGRVRSKDIYELLEFNLR